MYSGSNINFIASFPKSGTHLIAWILGELGLEDTKWQIAYDFTLFTDAADGKLLDAPLPKDVLSGAVRRITIDRNQIMPLIRKHQFAVGHLPPHVLSPELHFRIKSVLLVRGIRSALLSYYNYYRLLLPQEPCFSRFAQIEDPTLQMEHFLEASMQELSTLWRDMMAWRLYRSNLIVTYENLCSEFNRSNAIARLAEHFSIDAPKSKIDGILERYPTSTSPTKLALPKELRPGQWSMRCEELYELYGCADLDDEIMNYVQDGY